MWISEAALDPGLCCGYSSVRVKREIRVGESLVDGRIEPAPAWNRMTVKGVLDDGNRHDAEAHGH